MNQQQIYLGAVFVMAAPGVFFVGRHVAQVVG